MSPRTKITTFVVISIVLAVAGFVIIGVERARDSMWQWFGLPIASLGALLLLITGLYHGWKLSTTISSQTPSKRTPAGH